MSNFFNVYKISKCLSPSGHRSDAYGTGSCKFKIRHDELLQEAIPAFTSFQEARLFFNISHPFMLQTRHPTPAP